MLCSTAPQWQWVVEVRARATEPPSLVLAALPVPLHGLMSSACLLAQSSLVVHSTCSTARPRSALQGRRATAQR